MKISEILSENQGQIDPRAQWIQQVHDLYPAWPFDETYRVMSWEQPDSTKDEDVEFGIFELTPSETNPNAIELVYLEVWPKGRGVGSKVVREIKKLVADGNFELELVPKTVGIIPKSQVLQFFKQQDFRMSPASNIQRMSWGKRV